VSARALLTGLDVAARQKRLAVALWLVNLVLAAAAALPAFLVLGDTLARSPAGDRLLEGFSIGIVAEALHTDSRFRLLVPVAAAAGLVALIANAFTTGGVLDVLSTDDRRSFLHRFGRGAGHFAGRFFRMGIAAAITLLVPAALVMAGGRALRKALADSPWPPTDVVIGLGRLVLLLAIAVTALVALDLARIRVVREDSRRVVRLYGSSLALVLRHPLATLGLWSGNALALAFVVGVYVAFRNLVPATTWAGIVLMLAAQQAVMLARAGLRIALFAGEMTLVDRLLPAVPALEPLPPAVLDSTEPDPIASPS
jgi:hypothetical protein